MSTATWQILDVGSIWMKEFASALSSSIPTVAWEPSMSKIGAFQRWTRSENIAIPHLKVNHFPLQNGYSRRLISWLLPYEHRLLKLLHAYCDNPRDSPLICSTPFYAPVAEKWPGPVAYYSTDLTFAYQGVDSAQVNRLDRRMCRRATIVLPNSKRIAEYFVEQAGCDPRKIKVVPNATRQSNIAEQPLLTPSSLPADIAHLPRPIAGVIGNLSANMDWILLQELLRISPQLTWVFVGPTSMPIADPEQSAARARVQQKAAFVGSRSYGELQQYARAFDVAVLPYRRKEPTHSGSSTRFYEHLAACRPMIATRGLAELLEKPPLLTLIDTPAEFSEVLQVLDRNDFQDGYEAERWRTSLVGTWEHRARSFLEPPLCS